MKFMNRDAQNRNPFTVAQGLTLFAALLIGSALSAPAAEETKSDSSAQPQVAKPEPAAPGSDLPERKQTVLGFYVTAKEAYDMWKADPETVTILDVRTPEEYGFVGHPEGAVDVPYAFVTYERKNGITTWGPKMNSDFVAEVASVAEPTDILLVMCRSGDRSARAVDLLAASGFVNAYTVTDGFEGDKVSDPENVFFGMRMKNGWKNSAPWTYSIDPEKIILEESNSVQTGTDG